jgi:hypothetical protein
MKLQTIYRNGRVEVVALATLVAVEVGGKRLQVFDIKEVNAAVEMADGMAEQDGCYEHVA